MLLTVIVLYSFIIKFLKRDCDLRLSDEVDEINNSNYEARTPPPSPVSSKPIFSNSSSLLTSLAYERLRRDRLMINTSTSVSSPTSNEYVTTSSQSQREDELSDFTNNQRNQSAKSPITSDGDDDAIAVDDNNQDEENLNEEEFYNIIATKAAAFQSKRNSSTSTISSGSMFDESYRTKRNSLRSQSSTCSDIMETSSNRRCSEERIQNRKLNYKARRHGFTTLSKRRRTTGRYLAFCTKQTH